jgi:hypothetical protein
MLSTDSVVDGGKMVFFVLAALLSWLVDLGTLRWQSDRDKELEILLLRRLSGAETADHATIRS